MSYNLDVAVLGQALTPNQRVAIKMSLTSLKLNERLSNIAFWGKINGLEQDYFIAVVNTLNTTISKKYYFSVDEGVTFAALPAPVTDDDSAFVIGVAQQINERFRGNPSHKYADPSKVVKQMNEDGEDVTEDAAEDEAEPETDVDGNPIVKKVERELTELERLYWSVDQIDTATTLIPVGASFISPLGTVHYDRTFEGLSIAAIKSLDKFAFFRDAVNQKTLAQIRKNAHQNNYDYLDTIASSQESVRRQWTLIEDGSGLNVRIRSLLWLGYEFSIEALTTQYGGAYFGLGTRNDDLEFMI